MRCRRSDEVRQIRRSAVLTSRGDEHDSTVDVLFFEEHPGARPKSRILEVPRLQLWPTHPRRNHSEAGRCWTPPRPPHWGDTPSKSVCFRTFEPHFHPLSFTRHPLPMENDPQGLSADPTPPGIERGKTLLATAIVSGRVVSST